MNNTTPRRAFLQRTLLATSGLGLLSSQAIHAITATSPHEGYNPFAEEKTDLRSNLFGKELVVRGKIYDKSGTFPLPNALVEVWHLSPGTSKYRHRGKAHTDENGVYSFVTDLPEFKNGLMPKVHFKVSHDGSSQFTELTIGQRDAYILSGHWEKNTQLGDKLFPSSSTFLNTRTIQFNISI